MRYKTPIIAVAAFVVGYAVKSILAPSNPAELASALEKKLANDPVRYEQVIDQTREFAHEMKAQANQDPTMPGYVQFGDLRLDLKQTNAGNLTALVNTNTYEEQVVQYVNGKTVVGGYTDRLDSVKYETIQGGKQLLIDAKNTAKEKSESFLDNVWNWLRNICGSSKKTVEIEEKLYGEINEFLESN